jgi:hypothetical protein
MNYSTQDYRHSQTRIDVTQSLLPAMIQRKLPNNRLIPAKYAHHQCKNRNNGYHHASDVSAPSCPAHARTETNFKKLHVEWPTKHIPIIHETHSPFRIASATHQPRRKMVNGLLWSVSAAAVPATCKHSNKFPFVSCCVVLQYVGLALVRCFLFKKLVQTASLI